MIPIISIYLIISILIGYGTFIPMIKFIEKDCFKKHFIRINITMFIYSIFCIPILIITLLEEELRN